MEETDFNFLQIQGYSLSLQQWVSECRERVVRVHDNGSPIWSDLQRVADCVLFDWEVVEFEPLTDGTIEFGYWVPYRFWMDVYGECVVRVWYADLINSSKK